MKEIKVITTGDGSNSLYVPHLDETYHSSFGAITESEHIFIAAGLDYFRRLNPELGFVNIFELGFGSGLNALLSYRYAFRNQISLKYTSIERDPLPTKFALALNYPEQVEIEWSRKVFTALHECSWDREVQIETFFILEKIHCAIEQFEGQRNQADVIYYDAFAPGVQPAVWSQDILAEMFAMMKPGGLLVTYCAQGQFRRDLKAVGFVVEKLPGPPGKKEIVRAIKK